MTNYRVYVLNVAGKIASADWLEAEDDEAAVELARGLCTETVPALEVWRGPERLAVIDCAGNADTAADAEPRA